MKPLPISELAQIVGGEPIGFKTDVNVTGFALDDREVKPGNLFVAIKGQRVDGHKYARAALDAGAIGTLSIKRVEGPHLKVPNTVEALAALGKHFRHGFRGPVVGITGSAGKTTTKEFLAAALSPLGPVLKSEGNRNTEYTSPLLWTDRDERHCSAVVEMGMRGFGHIAHLASISQPNVGIITNIGYAHLSQVGSQAGIAKAKGELLESLPASGTAVLWQGDGFLETLRGKVKGRVVTFGYTEFADCTITNYRSESWRSCIVEGVLDGKRWEARLPAVGQHIGLNAAAAVLAAWVCGVDPAEAAAQIEHSTLPPMRMEVLEYNGATIVLDAYNASPPGMVAAIETLAEVAKGRKRAVIGEMKELGQYTEDLHRMVGRALVHHGIDDITFYGDATEYVWNECLGEGMAPDRFHIAHSLDDVTSFLRTLEPGDTVLVKGSRALELERALVPLGVAIPH